MLALTQREFAAMVRFPHTHVPAVPPSPQARQIVAQGGILHVLTFEVRAVTAPSSPDATWLGCAVLGRQVLTGRWRPGARIRRPLTAELR